MNCLAALSFRPITLSMKGLSRHSIGATSSTPQSPFHQSSPAPNAVTGFDALNTAGSSSSPFGQNTQQNTLSSPSLFANQPTTAPSPSQGMTNVAGMMASSIQSINGPREMLTAFYQRTNPDKISQVDALLAKYQGNHELMFRNLAKKYNLDPSMFGLSANVPASAGFGQSSAGGTQGYDGTNASPFGGAQNSFGQSSSGGTSFGLTSSATSISGASGFGSTTPLGGSLFSQASTPTTGFVSAGPGGFGSSGFGSSNGPSFGSLAGGSQPSFGASGTSFGSPFGSATPFGAPRK